MPSRLLLVALASMYLGPFAGFITGEEGDENLGDRVLQARRDHDDGQLKSLQDRLLEIEKERPDDYSVQRWIAATYLFRADLLRTARKIRDLDSDTNSKYRESQAEWGEAGLAHAERAMKLADGAEDKAQAERIAGELYVHQITGPISGLINGPKALEHILNALEKLPDDPECNRAQGLMFLFNPPINGGDVEQAIKTFRKCADARPDGDHYYLYLAMAFRKKGKPLRAEFAARKALRINEKNFNARKMLDELKKEKE